MLKIKVTTFDCECDDDECDGEHEHELPAKYEVCGRCEGHGTHLNPSIGEHAYSSDEFEEAFPEDEDKEQYFRHGGIYDVTCYACKGERVVLMIDRDACERDPDLAKILEAVDEQDEMNAAIDREQEAERRMGA